MNDRTDQQLLRDYVAGDSAAAFSELVRRHLDLVHSAAVRMTVDRHLADDVTQAVFVALAQRASSLTDRPVLASWLHRTTQNLAAKAVRTEVRRRAREQEAATMQTPASETEAVWNDIAPHLDAALGQLDDADRDALLLRYFERKSAREIGARLGLGEEAAQKRVSRALDRLRGVFVARGLAIPAATLGGAITLQAVQTAPAALAGTVLAGVASSTIGATTAFGLFQLMASTKFTAGVMTLVIAGATTTLLVQRRDQQRLRAELAELLAASVAPAVASSTTPEATAADPAAEELLRLRGEVARLRLLQQEAERLRAENKRLQTAPAAAARRPAATAGDAFLAANAAREGVTQTASGLQYKVISSGAGRTPTLHDRVKVHYHGTHIDGTVFDSSVDRGTPLEIPVAAVIPGWTEALQLMKEGDKWQLVIPAKLAYGERGGGPKIGPDSTLIFDVELLEIAPAKEN